MISRLSRTSQRRFTEHYAAGRPLRLSDHHPAIIEGRSLFPKNFHEGRATGRLLMTGHNQRKLGRMVEKGRWTGFPIYSLTLEERATCPRSCALWRDCYGNAMPRSIRHKAGDALLVGLYCELSEYQERFPHGFVVRLHILGDFYSLQYVEFWRLCLDAFPALHVFGYTARADEIGEGVRKLSTEKWDRFAIRSSGGGLEGVPAARTIDTAAERGDAIICPAQTGRTDCCATCALCWSTTKTIAFLKH